MKNFLTSLSERTLVIIALVPVVLSVAGSLYFSEYEGYLPCDLCWWQRIFMYPQLFLLITALAAKDWRVYRFSLPLLITGWAISAYQSFLYYQENFWGGSSLPVPCRVDGVSCTARYVEYFGFVSIPLLSFLSFTFIIVVMMLLRAKAAKK